MSVVDPKIITRAEWGAVKVENKLYDKKNLPIFTILVSLKTGLADCNTNEECMKILKDTQAKAISENKIKDIPFSFVISRDGAIYEGRGWDAKPQKAIQMEGVDFNPYAYDIGFFGDYEKVELPDTPFNSMISLLQAGVNKKYVDELYDLEQVRTEEFKPEVKPGLERMKKIKKIKVKGPVETKPYKGHKGKKQKGKSSSSSNKTSSTKTSKSFKFW